LLDTGYVGYTQTQLVMLVHYVADIWLPTLMICYSAVGHVAW